MEAALSGQLRSFKLYDLLTFLDMSRKSGVLSVRNETHEVFTYFREGGLVYASSNISRLRIGDILVSREMMTPEQHTEVEGIHSNSGNRFGRVAVRMGFVTEEQLKTALKVQVSEIIYECMSWRTGVFDFSEDLALPEDAVTISVNVSNLIMEGARRIDEWEECLSLLPDEHAIFVVVDNPGTAERISLSLSEWKILFKIDGQRTLSDVVKESDKEPLEVYRIIYGLLKNKLIEQVDDTYTRKTIRQRLPEPIPSPAGHTGKIIGPIEISDEEWQKFEDDTPLLVSEIETLSFRQIRKMAVTVARLSAVLPDGKTQISALVEPEYVIGRSPTCDIQYADSGVSARHARLTMTEDGYVIEDLDSRNGTYVNDAPADRQLLKDGDEVRIGRVLLEYGHVFDVE
jgi:hypothetical protein